SVIAGGVGEHGCEPCGRRHQRRGDGPLEFPSTTHLAQLCDFRARRLSLFVLDSARRRRAWHVRLQRCQGCVVPKKVIYISLRISHNGKETPSQATVERTMTIHAL